MRLCGCCGHSERESHGVRRAACRTAFLATLAAAFALLTASAHAALPRRCSPVAGVLGVSVAERQIDEQFVALRAVRPKTASGLKALVERGDRLVAAYGDLLVGARKLSLAPPATSGAQRDWWRLELPMLRDKQRALSLYLGAARTGTIAASTKSELTRLGQAVSKGLAAQASAQARLAKEFPGCGL